MCAFAGPRDDETMGAVHLVWQPSGMGLAKDRPSCAQRSRHAGTSVHWRARRWAPTEQMLPYSARQLCVGDDLRGCFRIDDSRGQVPITSRDIVLEWGYNKHYSNKLYCNVGAESSSAPSPFFDTGPEGRKTDRQGPARHSAQLTTCNTRESAPSQKRPTPSWCMCECPCGCRGTCDAV